MRVLFGCAKHMVPSALAVLSWALLAFDARADAIETLNAFLKTTQSAQASFTQTVTSPQKPGQSIRRKVSKGSFKFIRPHQFRFDYTTPFAQMILADGQTLWVYDKDISQVTARSQALAMGSTPAALIALAVDVSFIQRDFELEVLPNSEGLEWVKGTPKKPDGPLLWVRFGLKQTEQGVMLYRLDMRDAFHQDSSLSFSDFLINPKTLTAEQFGFKPPQGAEVIRQ